MQFEIVALILEAERIRESPTITNPIPVHSVIIRRAPGRGAEQQSSSVPEEYTCGRCGAVGKHFNKDCPYKKYKCQGCHQIGHLQKVCRNTAIKDPKGKVKSLLVNNPGSIQFHQAVDRTLSDRLNTASGILELLQEWAKQKNRKQSNAKNKTIAQPSESSSYRVAMQQEPKSKEMTEEQISEVYQIFENAFSLNSSDDQPLDLSSTSSCCGGDRR